MPVRVHVLHRALGVGLAVAALAVTATACGDADSANGETPAGPVSTLPPERTLR